MDYILYWLMAFLPIVLFKILYLHYKKIRKNRDSMVFTEALGLPLTFMQPFVFFKSLLALDFLGVFLTVWWGLGLLTVIGMMIRSKITKIKINWSKSSKNISRLCRFYYLMYIGVAFSWHMPKLMFALSVWIATDQIEKSFTSLDADRTRRTFHDFWLIRILYPTLLFTPFFCDLSLIFKIYGALLFALWALGLHRVYREKEFMNVPDDPSLLRNMAYFKD